MKYGVCYRDASHLNNAIRPADAVCPLDEVGVKLDYRKAPNLKNEKVA